MTQYISHRLGVAGYQGKPLFTTEALQLIAEESGGNPRNINNICFGALSTAFALGQKRIDRKIIEEVAGEQSFRSLQRRMSQSPARATQPKDPSGSETGQLRGSPCAGFFAMAGLAKQARSTA